MVCGAAEIAPAGGGNLSRASPIHSHVVPKGKTCGPCPTVVTAVGENPAKPFVFQAP